MMKKRGRALIVAEPSPESDDLEGVLSADGFEVERITFAQLGRRLDTYVRPDLLLASAERAQVAW